MRNFDDERHDVEPYVFQIKGRQFRAQRGVRPEVLAAWEDASDRGANGLQIIEATDTVIRAFLVPEDRDAWNEIRSDDFDPVTEYDMAEIVKHLVENQAGRPTRASSPSSSGDANVAASSTDGSPSQEAILTP